MASANIPDVNVNSAEGPTMAPDWMGNLPEKLHTVPLNSLAIPGSHDSFTYYLDKSGPISPGESAAIKRLSKLHCAKKIMWRWSITQSLNVSQQLHAGIRYFDIRLAPMPGTTDLHIVHGLYGPEFAAILKDLQSFLEVHKHEVVILDCNHMYNMDNPDLHSSCLAMIQGIFRGKLCPYTDLNRVSLASLWQHQHQVLCFYHNDIVKDWPDFWPGNRIPSPWPRTTKVRSLLQYLETEYDKGHPAGCLEVTQGVLTPSSCYLLGHVISSLKKTLSSAAAKAFVDWVRGKKTGTKKGINICILDFVEMQNYIPTIINLNR